MRENTEKTAEGVVNDVDVGEHADTADDLKNLEADGENGTTAIKKLNRQLRR